MKVKNSTFLYIIGIFIPIAIYSVISLLRGNPTIPNPVTIEYLERKKIISFCFMWGITLLIFLFSKYIEKGKFLLFEEEKKSLKFYILSVLILFFGYILINIVVYFFIRGIGVSSDAKIDYSILNHQKTLYIWLSAFTAGFCEEMIFRGFILSRLAKIFKKPMVAIFISAILFSLAHYNYGHIGMLINSFGFGLISGIFYTKYKNIKALIITHFLVDFILLYFFQ